MVFSSLPFICIFLPLVFLLHTLIRSNKARNVLLMIASVLFYSYGEPLYVILLLGSVTVNYFLGLGLKDREHRNVKSRARSHAKLFMVLGVAFNIALLGVFKYSGFLIGELNRILPAGMQLAVPHLALPIGISFYTFQVLSYLVDVYRGETPVQRNFISLLLYVSFFPQLIAGPIVKYHDIAEQMNHRKLTPEGMSKGLIRFITGLGKKVLIANGMAVVTDSIFALPAAGLGTLGAWMGAVGFLFQDYFDFSGYSDMAIGLGQMFGFRFKENFNYPYISTSCSEFWRRWHISLNTWFREYLYFPLGGNRKGKVRTYVNLWLVFLFTGIWHGAAWTYVAWGLFQGCFIILERLKLVPFVKNKITGNLYTMLVMLVGLIIFRSESLAYAGEMLKGFFGFGGAMSGETYSLVSTYFGPYYLALLALSVFFSLPLFRNGWLKIRARLAGKRRASILFMGATMAGALAVLALSLIQLATDSYNPFIYFRF
ncbi:MAG: MBOAT family protein [Lachnospiraceae bacterium]|nr:MBOAT family protein [Lachnospiraceae bacterium]